MASNKGIWIMLGGGLAVGLGVAVFVIGFVGKRAENQEMRSQVEQWGQEYVVARLCLTGEDPLTPNARDSVILRDATGSTSLDSCWTHFEKKLARPGSTSVRNSKVEAGWRDLDSAIGDLARAFARRIDGHNPDAEIPRYRRELGDALAKVDASYATLRAAAGLGVWTPPGEGEIPAMGARTPVKVAGKTMPSDDVAVFGDSLVISALLGDSHATTVAVVTGPEAIKAFSADPAVVRAADDTAWGVRNARNDKGNYELRASGIDADGAARGDGVAVAATAGPDEELAVMFATGAGQRRAIVYQLQLPEGEPTLWLALSSDGGATWPDNTLVNVPVETYRMDASIDVAHRRFDLQHRDMLGDGSIRWFSVRGDALSTPPAVQRVPIGEAGPYSRCYADGYSWWLAGSALYRKGASEMSDGIVSLGGQDIVACDEQRAVLVLRNNAEVVQFLLCDATTCKAHVKVPVGDAQPIVVLGKELGVVVATAISDLLVVWRVVGNERVFDAYRRPDEMLPYALQESNGALYAVFIGESSVDHAALVPAR